MSDTKVKKIIFGVQMPVSLRDDFIACAATNDQKASQVIRQAMREYIARHGQPDFTEKMEQVA